MQTATEPATPAYDEALSWAEVVVAVALRGVELVAIAVATVFIAPPLVILAVIVLLPLVALGAVAGIVALPVVAVRSVQRYRAAHPHHVIRRMRARSQRRQYA